MIRNIAAIFQPETGLQVRGVRAVHTAVSCREVIESPPRADDGRSQWLLFTMSDGTKIFGCYTPPGLVLN